MRQKHLVNDPTQLVQASLQSVSLTNASCLVDLEKQIVYAPSSISDDKVAIVSGGGAGHEPSFTGFVGPGILTAAVSGTVFASPNSKQVLAAIGKVKAASGVLVTVMNYTGDVMNFGVAIEKAKALHTDARIEMLVVGDDVSVPRTQAGKVGRRGIAGTVLVHKITGAMAASGINLNEIVRVGRLVVDNLVSIGASLDRVHVPGRTVTEDTGLQPDELELGMGIHNETGTEKRRGASKELPNLVRDMLKQLLDPKDEERAFLTSTSANMVLLLNSLGGLSVLELGAVLTEVHKQLGLTYSIKPTRIYSGTFMTALDGPGFSISLLNADLDPNTDVVGLLDTPSDTIGWSVPQHQPTRPLEEAESSPVALHSTLNGMENGWTLPSADMQLTLHRLGCGLRALIDVEPEVTKFDTIVGDGDCGTTLRRGAEEIMKRLDNQPSSVTSLLSLIVSAVEDTMDGTSGALYSIFINALLQRFCQKPDEVFAATTWSLALNHALSVLSRYTPARTGDRTVIDALDPFVQSLSTGGDLAEAAKKAQEAAEGTKHLKAKLGRTVYIGGGEDWLGKIPDPGAYALAAFLKGLAS
ncbi:Dihydroxyacetone kinase [Elsinoe australis]|uniref:Dihydroxyacetone kinase n=1 Tax=Elsinoe australis TaxID=40998 RepID=A0A2P7ZQ09_9PEZI|nr:Dihydroxyacetone kinase [Elsinoe australis]